MRKNKLRDFTPDDKIVNRFEEILRHNNVSDKENAFNRLVALFICKLVDEIKKQDFEEVEFQYKQGTDTYESLQDRLQRLHTQGMEEFMKEKIFYVAADYAERLFLQYTGKKRKQAIEDLNNTIRILKFYLRTKKVREIMSGNSKGSNIQSVNQKTLYSLVVPVPSMSEQNRILEEVSDYERQIKESKDIILSCTERKKAVLECYLR